MKYRVDISPDAKKEFVNYLDGAEEFGAQTVTDKTTGHLFTDRT